jgi:hypothetical protein
LNKHTRLQLTLNDSIQSDIELERHFHTVKRELPSLKSDAAALRHILEQHRQVAKVYGVAWDWRNIVKAPPWMDKILGAITAFDGRARVIVEDVKDTTSRVEFEEGIFDE